MIPIVCFQEIIRTLGSTNYYRSVIDKFNQTYILPCVSFIPTTKEEFKRAYDIFFNRPPPSFDGTSNKIKTDILGIDGINTVDEVIDAVSDIYGRTSNLMHCYERLGGTISDFEAAMLVLRLPESLPTDKILMSIIRKYIS